MSRSLIVLAACLLAGACGSGSGRAAPPPTTGAHAIKVASECRHLPIAQALDSYDGLPKLGGTSFDYIGPHVYSPIKGRDDSLVTTDRGTVLDRGAARTVRITPGSSDLAILLGIGDFDGDARRDLLVKTYTGGNPVGSFMVLGTVPAGEHAAADVGIPIATPLHQGKPAGWSAAPVGDQDGDGADDVSIGPMLYSGRQVAANTGGQLPKPFRTLPSPWVGVLQLSPNDRPTFVLADNRTSSLQVLDQRSDRLVLQGAPAELTTPLTFGRAVGWIVNGEHIVEFAYPSRSGTSAWRWNLDAPCTR